MKAYNLETFRLGVNKLRLHKLRSLLTSLGIIFGVAAVICMLSISEAASADEMRLIQLLGTRNIIVNSVKPPQTTQSSQSHVRMTEYGIIRADGDIIKATIPAVTPVVPPKPVAYRARHCHRPENFNCRRTTRASRHPTPRHPAGLWKRAADRPRASDLRTVPLRTPRLL